MNVCRTSAPSWQIFIHRTYHTCSVYFNYTRFFTRTVRKCQFKGRCFNSINSIFSKTTSISMKVILKDVIAITESKHENEFRVLPSFEDFDLRITEIAHQPTLSATFWLHSSFFSVTKSWCFFDCSKHDFSYLQTGTPFYVVTRATRRSNRLQGNGSTFISQLFQVCQALYRLS